MNKCEITVDQNALRSVSLRDVIEDDLPFFFEYQREPAANQMAAFPARSHDAFMSHWHTKVLNNPNARKKTIVVDEVAIGNILSWERDGKRLVGYWISSRYWGRGIATFALAQFLAKHENIRPIFASVALENFGSIRVLEKCGFQRAGKPIIGADGIAEITMELSTPT